MLFKSLMIFFFIAFITSCKNDNMSNRNEDKGSEKDLYILDTINIDDPLLIRFTNDNDEIEMILISKKNLDSINYSTTLDFKSFISSSGGYLFFPPNRFSCLINNFINKNEVNSKTSLILQDNIRNAHNDSIWVFDKNNKKEKIYKGWNYEEIYPRKFLICLVKGSALELCQSLDEIPINDMDNLYVKVLVPITWE